jgi:hypothetical protein
MQHTEFWIWERSRLTKSIEPPCRLEPALIADTGPNKSSAAIKNKSLDFTTTAMASEDKEKGELRSACTA